MSISTKNLRLTTCRVVASPRLKRQLRTLVRENQTPDADIVVGRCEDCGALLYAEQFLATEPALAHTPEPIDEWECLL